MEKVIGKDIMDMVNDYDLYLNAYGYADPLVRALRAKLEQYGDEDIRDEIDIINYNFDMAVFNNQTEGRF